MSHSQTESDFTTYGALTAERILAGFKIKLEPHLLSHAIKNPHSIYYQLIDVPFKNILNGIILQQAHDYRVYVQKLLIDYLLSGETSKEESSPGVNVRDNLEDLRKQFIELGEAFDAEKLKHETLIATSQASFIKIAKVFLEDVREIAKKLQARLADKASHSPETIEKSILYSLIYTDALNGETPAATSKVWEALSKLLKIPLDGSLCAELAQQFTPLQEVQQELFQTKANYAAQAEEIALKMCDFRTQLASYIRDTLSLIQQLPEYLPNEERDAANRVSIYFDPNIGKKN